MCIRDRYKALMDQNKTEDARAVLEEALKLGGSKGQDLVNQGNIYLKLGEYASAEEKFKKALDKGEVSAHLGYAELYRTCLLYTSDNEIDISTQNGHR